MWSFDKNHDRGGQGLTSQAQIDANRRNSLKSTGPKNTSLTSSNAMKHGLTANRFVVLPGENLNEYEILLKRMYEDYKPQTVLEEILIEQLVSDYWRLLRIKRSETAEIGETLAYAPLNYSREEDGRRSRAVRGEYGDFVSQVDSLKLLETTNEERKRLYCTKLLRPELNALLMRYESGLEHRIYRALITLIRIQEIRNGFVSQKNKPTTRAKKIG
jgi:hypothetical protein